MTLSLNMGYYHIRLNKEASNLCTIIIPWRKYLYKCLPMGVSDSPDILQDKMNGIFCWFEFIRLYMNDLFRITNGYCYNHLEKLELILQNIKDIGLKCNIKNSFFGKTKMKQLGFQVTQNGIQAINKKW